MILYFVKTKQIKHTHNEKHNKRCDYFVYKKEVQKNRMFITALHDWQGSAAYGPPNQTETWQPIDAGHLGATLKELARQSFTVWLEGQFSSVKEVVVFRVSGKSASKSKSLSKAIVSFEFGTG